MDTCCGWGSAGAETGGCCSSIGCGYCYSSGAKDCSIKDIRDLAGGCSSSVTEDCCSKGSGGCITAAVVGLTATVEPGESVDWNIYRKSESGVSQTADKGPMAEVKMED